MSVLASLVLLAAVLVAVPSCLSAPLSYSEGLRGRLHGGLAAGSGSVTLEPSANMDLSCTASCRASLTDLSAAAISVFASSIFCCADVNCKSTGTRFFFALACRASAEFTVAPTGIVGLALGIAVSVYAVAATGIACRRSTIAIAAVGSLLTHLPMRLALTRRSLPGTPRQSLASAHQLSSGMARRSWMPSTS